MGGGGEGRESWSAQGLRVRRYPRVRRHLLLHLIMRRALVLLQLFSKRRPVKWRSQARSASSY